MIPLLLGAALAAPGRTTATATVGAALTPTRSDAPIPLGVVARGTLDYGLTRRLAVGGEVGVLPGGAALAVGAGPMLELVDSRWWRLDLCAQPELVIPLDVDVSAELPVRHEGPRLGARAGLHASWLAFWGVSLVGRAETAMVFDGQPPWVEAGLGIGLRM